MWREYIFICGLTWLFLPLRFSERFFASGESGDDYSKGCAHLRCEKDTRCVKRRFWCKDPPCPGMLYCSKSRRESLTGPLTCDTVRCNKGHMCIVKVRGCQWDRTCKQQLARCVSVKEYYEGTASCAGFECPSGEHCILRETFCINPPCKLIRSCKNTEDVQTWFNNCKSLNCASEYECFLRRPENNCLDSWCTHTPDCMFTVEDELISKYCYGWICPRAQKCVVQIIGSCKGFNCTIERSCRASSVSSTKRSTNVEVVEQPLSRRTLVETEREPNSQELERGTDTTSYPITKKKFQLTLPVASTQSIRHTTNTEHGTTLPRFQLNYNKPSTMDEGKVFQSSTSPASWPADAKTESATSRDTERLETPRQIHVTTDDASPLSVMLKDINVFQQGYPIWIKNDPYHSWEVKDGWRDHAPQEPYKILLPPYEPVILIEDTRRREPFFNDVLFTDLFSEATLIPSSEISADIKNSKADSTPTVADDKPADCINDCTIVEPEDIETIHTDSSNDHTSVSATEKTNIPPSIRDKEPDNYYDDYEWGPWLMIDDYLERNEPQSSRSGSKLSTIDLATDDLYENYTSVDAETSARIQIANEKRSRDSEMRYVDGRNKNLTTFSPPASTGQGDYSARDTISVRRVDKSSRQHRGSSPKRISDVSLNGDGNTA